MTNLEELCMEMHQAVVVCDRRGEELHPDYISDDLINLFACPLEIDDNFDASEIEGKPTSEQCAACKRRWLMAEAR